MRPAMPEFAARCGRYLPLRGPRDLPTDMRRKHALYRGLREATAPVRVPRGVVHLHDQHDAPRERVATCAVRRRRLRVGAVERAGARRVVPKREILKPTARPIAWPSGATPEHGWAMSFPVGTAPRSDGAPRMLARAATPLSRLH